MESSVWAGLPILVTSYYCASGMGFFSFLFPRPAVFEDDFFGHLVSESSGQYGSPYCYYAEQVRFQPTGTGIECMLDTADTNGPTLAQREFFQHFEQVYASLLPFIIAVVENDSQLLAAGTPLINFASTHRLAGISIPELSKASVEWDMWFEPLDTSHWGYSVQVDMVNDVPQAGIGISA